MADDAPPAAAVARLDFVNPKPLDYCLLFLSSILFTTIFLLGQELSKQGIAPLPALFIQVLVAAFLLSALAIRNGVFRHWQRQDLLTYAFLGCTYILIPGFLTLLVSQHLPAYLLALISICSTPLTYVVAALLKMERYGAKQFMALLVMMLAVGLIILDRHGIGETADLFWVGVALLMPLSWTVTNIMRARLWRPHYSILSYLSGVLLLALGWIILVLAILALHAPHWLAAQVQSLSLPALPALMALGVCAAAYYGVIFFLVRRTGASFTATNGIISLVLTIPTGLVLFGQTPSLAALGAAVVAIAGIFFMKQKEGAKK